MTFATYSEFKRAVETEFAHERYANGCRIILQNRNEAPAHWVRWAERVLAGDCETKPIVEQLGAELEQAELFGEALTTGKRARPFRKQRWA